MTYEMVTTFYSTPESFEESDRPDELPSLEEMERRMEDVLEAARLLEATFAGIANAKEAYVPILEAAGGGVEAAAFDREELRVELRKLMLGDNGSSSRGDDVVPADGGGSEG